MSARKEQGWINYYRKPFLAFGVILFFWMWLFTENPLPLSESFLDLMEGFGSLLMIIGVLGRMYSSLTIAGKKNQKVIQTEIYSVVRHPLYFFSFLMVVGAGILTERVDLLIVAVGVFMICFFPMMANEQKYLEKLFGDEYRDYMTRTPFFIPNFRQWKARDELTIDLKLVTKSMMDAFFGLLIIPGIEVVEFIHHLFIS